MSLALEDPILKGKDPSLEGKDSLPKPEIKRPAFVAGNPGSSNVPGEREFLDFANTAPSPRANHSQHLDQPITKAVAHTITHTVLRALRA